MATVTPYSLRELLADELRRDEEVLWASQPDPSILFAKADRFLVPFSLLWGGFAIFWEAMVVAALLRGEHRSGNGGNLWFFVVFGSIFVVVGLYFIFGRFVYKKIKKRNTYYAVTNKRVLVLTTLRGRHVNAAFIDRIPSVQKSVNSKGVGTLHFGNTPGLAQAYENTGMDFFGAGYSDSAPAFTTYGKWTTSMSW